MNKTVISLRNMLVAPAFEDEEKTRIAGLLNTILLAVLAVLTVSFVVFLVILSGWLFSVLLHGALILLSSIAFVLLRRGHVQLACVLFTSALWITIALVASLFGGVRSTTFSANILIIFIAGLLLGGRAAVAFAALSILAGSGMLYTELKAVSPHLSIDILPTPALLTNSACFIAAAILLYLLSDSFKAALDRAHRNERDLLTEVDERRRAEQALRESEERLLNIVGGTQAWLVNVDARGRFTYVNSAVARTMGYQQQEMIGKLYLDFVHYEDKDRVSQTYLEQIKTQKPSTSLEFRVVTAAGQVRWVNFATNPVIDNGQVVGQTGVALDITERKQAKEELRQLKEFNESIVQSMAEGILVEDAQGYYTFVNPAAAAMLGYAPDKLLGQHWTASVPPDQQAIVRAANARRAQRKADQYELDLLRQDVAPVINIHAQPLYSQSGNPAGDTEQYQIIVEDNGIGFDQKYTERIFQVFQRLHGTGKYEGTGMGLAICRKIVERHAGSITAKSSPGQGTAFIITLPIRQSKEEPQ